MITLKPFNTKDKTEAELLVKIVHEYYNRSAWPPTVELILKTETLYFKAYNEDNQFVGMSGIAMKTPTLCETVKTIVFKEYRGKKYGEELSLAIENECKKLGVKKILSTIYTDNIPMVIIKLKQGYKFEGHHPNHERPGFDEYSLGKVIV